MKFTRKRFTSDGFDLDLCYLSQRIIVMGNVYSRDSLSEFRAFLKTFHPGAHKIYNLACEPELNMEQDIENVENFPFNANNPCALPMLITLCSNIIGFLSIKTQNVVLLHCSTGKGRSCLIAACCLLHCGIFTDATEAISFVCRQRTPLKLNALKVPSQMRYVHYYERLLRQTSVPCYTYHIQHIRMNTVPSFSTSISNCGCTPYTNISVLASVKNSELSPRWYPKRVFGQLEHETKKSLKRYSTKHDTKVEFGISKYDVYVRGDVCLAIYSQGEKMLQVYFNTCFVDGNYLRFERKDIDIAHKDQDHFTYDPGLSLEIYLQRVEDDKRISVLDPIDSAGSAVQNSYELNAIFNFADTNVDESDEES